MIPEAAVAAACVHLRSDEIAYRDVILALEAAAPHIAAQALDDAADTFESLPVNKGASISSGTWDWFELFPIQHLRDRAEDIRSAK